MSIPTIVHALDFENGTLRYEGGQTSKQVYDIKTRFRHTKSDDKTWGCKASVKIGGTTTTSGFRMGTASISADRHWYTNETSYYDYEQLYGMKEYTEADWGRAY